MLTIKRKYLKNNENLVLMKSGQVIPLTAILTIFGFWLAPTDSSLFGGRVAQE